MVKFFNEFINKIRNKKNKNIGIITDKDGTLLLNDELLKALERLKSRKLDVNIYIIVNTGRTKSDMEETLKENKIVKYVDFIIGDNGAICYDLNSKKELFKHALRKESATKAISKFYELGGTKNNIRITDGDNLYAYPSEEIKKYYKDKNKILYIEDIENFEHINPTKITFTGDKELIGELNKYLRDTLLEERSHIGKTSFPEKRYDNYRLDFTGKNTKGSAAKYLRNLLKLDFCIYLGNDLNDIPMFSQAIEDKDFAVIANNEETKITNMVIEYLKKECQLKNIKWEDVNLLLLKENDVNKFLIWIGRILNTINSKNNMKSEKNKLIKKYESSLKVPKTRTGNKHNINYKYR